MICWESVVWVVLPTSRNIPVLSARAFLQCSSWVCFGKEPPDGLQLQELLQALLYRCCLTNLLHSFLETKRSCTQHTQMLPVNTRYLSIFVWASLLYLQCY